MSLTRAISFLAFISQASAGYLDDTDGSLSGIKFDLVKFKTKTDCQLDTYPNVSLPLLNINDLGSRIP